MDIASVLSGYDPKKIAVGSLGGHSALDVAHGGKQAGLRTLVVAQEGREKTYKRFVTRGDDGNRRGCVDELIVLPKFADILREEVQEQLRAASTLFVHSRYFWVYVQDFAKVESEFRVPIFGSRHLLKLEERDQPYTQYDLLRAAGIRTPRIFKTPEDMDDTLCIVKVHEAARGYERAFFLANHDTYGFEAAQRLKTGAITEEALQKAVIEEFVVGAPVNFNYFYSPLTRELELLGTDTRRQTNLDGFLRMTAPEQKQALRFVMPKMIETGHIAVTVKESLLEKAFELGERFVEATRKLGKKIDPAGKGIIGPFALQGAVVAEEGKEDIIIFDVSLRIPGSPGVRATPYSGYLYGQSMSVGERIGVEIASAARQGRLEEIVT